MSQWAGGRAGLHLTLLGTATHTPDAQSQSGRAQSEPTNHCTAAPQILPLQPIRLRPPTHPTHTVHPSPHPSARSEAQYGAILGPYLDDPANLFVISSDFCHWGKRFQFTFYDKSKVRRGEGEGRLWVGGRADRGVGIPSFRLRFLVVTLVVPAAVFDFDPLSNLFCSGPPSGSPSGLS